MENTTRCGDTANRGRRLTETMGKIFDGACRLSERSRYTDALSMALRCLYIAVDTAGDDFHKALASDGRFTDTLNALVDALLMV